jgi:hypothetical protein
MKEVPVSYLDWLMGELDKKGRSPLADAINAHLKTRPEWHDLDEDD